jgi:hypothetical protein
MDPRRFLEDLVNPSLGALNTEVRPCLRDLDVELYLYQQDFLDPGPEFPGEFFWYENGWVKSPGKGMFPPLTERKLRKPPCADPKRTAPR